MAPLALSSPSLLAPLHWPLLLVLGVWVRLSAWSVCSAPFSRPWGPFPAGGLLFQVPPLSFFFGGGGSVSPVPRPGRPNQGANLPMNCKPVIVTDLGKLVL